MGEKTKARQRIKGEEGQREMPKQISRETTRRILCALRQQKKEKEEEDNFLAKVLKEI